MNSIFETLSKFPYVRRVVKAESVVGVLTDDTIGLNDKPAALVQLADTGLISFHAPMSVIGSADCELLWDRVAVELRRRLQTVEGVCDIKHRWCGPGETVEVGVTQKSRVVPATDGGEHRFSLRETEERPEYPEGIYAIVVEEQEVDRNTAHAAYEASFLSAYKTDQKRIYEETCAEIRQRVRKKFFPETTRNAIVLEPGVEQIISAPKQPSQEQIEAAKTCVAEQVRKVIFMMEAADTTEARATYVAKAKKYETKEERENYLAGAARAACAERVSNALNGFAEETAWGVEIITTDEVDERYRDLP